MLWIYLLVTYMTVSSIKWTSIHFPSLGLCFMSCVLILPVCFRCQQGIEFSVTYKESDVIPYQQCETLVPNCRVDSHRQPCQGQVDIHQTGVYTLLFNNTSSRCFILASVLSHCSLKFDVTFTYLIRYFVSPSS